MTKTESNEHYKYCNCCSNLFESEFNGKKYFVCGANVNYPERCVLRKDIDNE